uniref:Uncharacterized protein n=1 Tax=Varanus komodoensis TaxID=61221 RepID=A0A8D2J512_VARKO
SLLGCVKISQVNSRGNIEFSSSLCPSERLRSVWSLIPLAGWVSVLTWLLGRGDLPPSEDQPWLCHMMTCRKPRSPYLLPAAWKSGQQL